MQSFILFRIKTRFSLKENVISVIIMSWKWSISYFICFAFRIGYWSISLILFPYRISEKSRWFWFLAKFYKFLIQSFFELLLIRAYYSEAPPLCTRIFMKTSQNLVKLSDKRNRQKKLHGQCLARNCVHTGNSQTAPPV